MRSLGASGPLAPTILLFTKQSLARLAAHPLTHEKSVY
jgi:hypothetical protein